MNWRSILATAIITGIVTVLSGAFMYWYQNKEADLVYTTIQSIPFNGKDKKVSIYQVDIENKGKKEADNVTFIIKLKNGRIEQSIIDIDSAISYSKTEESNLLSLSIDTLNPSEKIKISMLLDETNNLVIEPIISLRAKGIIGVTSIDQKNKSPLFIALIAAYSGLLAAILASNRGRKVFVRVGKSFLSGKGITLSGAQKYEIASALSIYGMPEKAKEYLNSTAERRYWAEADQLASEAIISKNIEQQKKTIDVLKQLLRVDLIANESASVVSFNIAKLHNSLGNEEKSKMYLEKALEFNEDRIKRRLMYDQALKNIKI